MSSDLAAYHHSISTTFRAARDSASEDDFRLSQEQVEDFHENGYISGLRVLSDQQIELLRAELEGLMLSDHQGRELWYEYHSNESTDPHRVLFHALGAWRIGTYFHDLLWEPQIIVPAQQLLAERVRFWHDQLFCKPALHGGVVAWHQDYSYWTRTGPMNHLTCWIGLDPSTEENGCLQYIPGSHRWELLPITGLAGDMDAIRDALTPEQYDGLQKPVAIELQAGECSFHHPLLVHGSNENRTTRPRRATVINFCGESVKSNSEQPLLAGTAAIPIGKPLGGKFFPLLGCDDSPPPPVQS